MTMGSWFRQLFTLPGTRTIRKAPRRVRDRLRAGRVAQLKLGAGQGDRLHRFEHGGVKIGFFANLPARSMWEETR